MTIFFGLDSRWNIYISHCLERIVLLTIKLIKSNLLFREPNAYHHVRAGIIYMLSGRIYRLSNINSNTYDRAQHGLLVVRFHLGFENEQIVRFDRSLRNRNHCYYCDTFVFCDKFCLKPTPRVLPTFCNIY